MSVDGMKSEFMLVLFDDDSVREKLKVLNCLETMFDDQRNSLPESLWFFTDNLPMGSKVKLTFELVE